MQWLNKVKQVAGDAATQVRSRVEVSQAQRRADDAAKELGYLIHQERTGGAPAGTDADALVTKLTDALDEIETLKASSVPEGKAKDPVCGMTVEIATAAFTLEHEGLTYYFCSQGCLDRFRADPKGFISA